MKSKLALVLSSATLAITSASLPAAAVPAVALPAPATAHAAARCPVPFKLNGKIDQYWSQVTNNAWNKMLPSGWVDNGFHFYSRIRERGPSNGINTPSDLESEIMKKLSEGPEGHPNRWQILLPIKGSSGKNFRILYDYDGKPSSKCQLVTLTY